MGMTRCCLTQAGLPKRLWGELASTAVFQKNRIPHSALGSDTPYYRMFGKNVDLSFLRVIGPRAFVHEEGHRDKLEQRAWEGVLVGYNNDSPTYRIYYNTNSKIVSSRSVKFIECVESNTPSMVDDIVGEGRKNYDDLEKNVYDGIQNLELTTLDSVEGSHGPVHQYNRMTLVVVVVVSHIQRLDCQPEKPALHGGQSRSWSAEQGKLRSSRKSRDNLAEAKSLKNSTLVGNKFR